VTEERRTGSEVAGRAGDPVEGIREAPDPSSFGEVDALQDECGLEQVGVRVDEGRRHECAAKVDDLVGRIDEAARGVVRAEPDDDPVRDQDSFRERVGRRVDHAIAVQSAAHVV